MAKNISKPVTLDSSDPMGGTIVTHPAFGQIRVSRISGARNLYGSDFKHNSYIEVSITESQLRRTLSRDWHFGRKPLLTFAISEAQWASFVSSMGVGEGTPCTLDFIHGIGSVDDLPDPESRVDQFVGEVQQRVDEGLKSVRETLALLETLDLPKAKSAKIREGLQKALRELDANSAFVAKQFEEHAEMTVEKAKAEIHGYMMGVLQRAGLEAISSGETATLTPPINMQPAEIAGTNQEIGQ